MKIKRILVSQPKPDSDKSPWYDVAAKHKLNLDFKPFIHTEGMPTQEFRKQRIDLAHYNCVIMNSRNAVDNYFRIANDVRYSVPEKTKYFCTTEAVALYLQKYIQYRKRKIFFAQTSIEELAEPIKKNKDEKFLFVCSDKATDKTTTYLEKNRINFVQGIFYRTVSSDMRSADVPGYDMICFFSPNGIDSLFENYPDFKQGNIRISVFGNQTLAAARAKGLRVDLAAPLPNAPSMTMALDIYVKEHNSKNGEISPMVVEPAPLPEPIKKAKTEKQPKVEKPKKEKEVKVEKIEKAKSTKQTIIKKSTTKAVVKKKPIKNPIKKSAVKKSTNKEGKKPTKKVAAKPIKKATLQTTKKPTKKQVVSKTKKVVKAAPKKSSKPVAQKNKVTVKKKVKR